MNSVIFIPARSASTRLPGKLLKKIGGKSVLQRTYEQCLKATDSCVVILAGDKAIQEEAQSFGAKVFPVFIDCKNGTERVAEIVRNGMAVKKEKFIIVQADEPFIDPDLIKRVKEDLVFSPITTAAVQRDETYKHRSKDVVVCSCWGPHVVDMNRGCKKGISFKEHLGIYGYTRWAFIELMEKGQTIHVEERNIELMKAIDYCYNVRCVITDKESVSINTKKELERARQYYEKEIA